MAETRCWTSCVIFSHQQPVFDTTRITSGEKCAVKGKRLKSSLSEETIPNFRNIPAKHIKCSCNAQRSKGSQMATKRKFYIGWERKELNAIISSVSCKFTPWATCIVHNSKLLDFLSAFIFAVMIMSAHSWVMLVVQKEKVISGEDVLLPLFQYLNWISFTVKFHSEVCLLFCSKQV